MCEDWDRAPANVREVPFRFDGLRIVNGAQTVSSINKAMGEPEKVAKAQVPIRFIKLKTTGAEFGARIAFATNRTNAMLPRDLLAMDHVQQRLRDEFKLTWGFTYAIRANDDLPAAASGCSVNPVIRTEDVWRLASDPLVRQIQSSPVVTVLVPDDGGTSGPLPAAGRSGDA